MSITRNAPNTVFLGGTRTQVNDLAASEAITPGMLVERFNNAGVVRVRKQVTAGADIPRLIATDMAMINKGVDDAYAANDLVEVSIGNPGSEWWLLIASGQTIVPGDGMESAGAGLIQKLTSGTRLYTALEAKTTTAQTRIRVEQV